VTLEPCHWPRRFCTKPLAERPAERVSKREDPDAEATIAAQLERSYPRSLILVRRQMRMAVAQRDYKKAAAVANKLPEHDLHLEAYSFLAEELQTSSVPDYASLVRRVEAEGKPWGQYAKRSVIQDALSRGLLVHALDVVHLCALGKNQPDAPAVLQILEVLTMLMLHRMPTGDLAVPVDRIESAVTLVVEYLARNPTESYVMGRLARFVSPEICGNYGVPLLAVVLLKQLSRPIDFSPGRRRTQLPPEILQKGNWVREAFAWLDQHSPIVLGASRLPPGGRSVHSNRLVTAHLESHPNPPRPLAY
jgi:hypothetical protein